MEILIEVKSMQTDYANRKFKRPEDDDNKAVSLQRWMRKNPNDELYLTLINGRTVLYEESKLINLKTNTIICYIF